MNNGLQQEVASTQETAFGGSTQSQQKKIIHFTSGETLEEDDSPETEEQTREPAERNQFSIKNVAILIGRISLLACDILGERLASALGLNAPKYQYVIDQYQHDHKEQSGGRTSDGLAQGEGEAIHPSPPPDGSRYGATGHTSRAAEPQGSHDGEGGHYNRSFRAEEGCLK